MRAEHFLSVALIGLAVVVYGLVHSWLASHGMKAAVQRWTGRWGERFYRLVYNLIALVSFLPVLALVGILPDRELYALPFPWVILTISLQAVAGLALVVGVLQTGLASFLGLSQLFEPQSGANGRLVIHGLYRWVRHPLYTAGLIFIWMAPVMTANLLALNMGLTAYILWGAILEERKLLAEYGEAYARYRRQTPMFLPWPGRSPG